MGAVLQQVIQEECRKLDDAEAVIETTEQTHAEEVLASDDAAVNTDAKVAEAKLASDDAEAKTANVDAQLKNGEVDAPCPKCKGTGKTNMMGGTRGFSFMKRQCKYCSSETSHGLPKLVHEAV